MSMRKSKKLSEACREWVETFNAIPMAVVNKLVDAGGNPDDDWLEVTPPTLYDRVYLYNGKYAGQYGEVVKQRAGGEEYLIRLDSDPRRKIVLDSSDFDVCRDSGLPMWGTMWAFNDSIDNDWLDGAFSENGLQKMADCGFRIYKQEDYGYVFGIDGAGYDFFERHWIPLYKARGLHWHTVDDTAKERRKTANRVKCFDIFDLVHPEPDAQPIDSIPASDGKSALKKFLREHVMSTGIYEFTKEDGVWHMRSTYGSDFVAREWG